MARSGLRCTRLEDIAHPGEARGAWQALALQSKNIFATWEWNELWWRHYGSSRPLFVSTCRDEDDRLIAVLPIYLWLTRPLRVARFLGHRAGDELGPLCRNGDEHRAASALRTLLDEIRADVLLAERMPVEAGWGRHLGGRRLSLEPSPSFDAAGVDWEHYLSGRGASFRQTLRRKQRRLEREHDVRFRATTSAEELAGDLDILFALHAARWGDSRTNFLRCEPFHRAFAAVALERGWLRLWLLEIDGVARAAWYGFRYAGVESFYQGGRDPDPRWQPRSLGLQILAHSIRAALEHGVEEYRLLRGGEAYKDHFARSSRAVETVSVADGHGARLALAAAVRLRRAAALADVVRR
jgi:CelD/BcsL family acetyltransferase involved in cellulose biosynthesis